MSVIGPLLSQGMVSVGLIVFVYGFFRTFRSSEYSGLAVGLVLMVLAALAVVNPIWGIWLRPWGSWLLYTTLSAVGGFLLLAVAAWLYDLLRPPGVKLLGPEAMAFLLPIFPYLIASLVSLVIRGWVHR
ncbi:MAG: hypothetical protein N2318_05910 [Meiothermus sp.]|nr:hypothetical protein [Meiothermus sp.]